MSTVAGPSARIGFVAGVGLLGCWGTTRADQCILETENIRLVLTEAGTLAEFVHLPTGTALGRPGYTFLCAVPEGYLGDDYYESYPTAMSWEEDIPSGDKKLTFYFDAGQIVLRAHAYDTFLEFRLDPADGSIADELGDICMLCIMRTIPDLYSGMPSQLSYLAGGMEGLVFGLIGGTDETCLYKNDNSWRTYSINSLPHPAYQRNQKAAVFVCPVEQMPDRVDAVEQHFDIPVGVNAKRDPANDLDYLMLHSAGSYDASEVIEVCQRLDFQSVMLMSWSWCAWNDSSEPFKLRPGVAEYIADLKVAGLQVGCHAYLHKIHRDGYFAVNYPEKVLDEIPPGEPEYIRGYDLKTDLPEIVAQAFAERYNELGFDWIFFDGAEDVGDPEYGWGETVDWCAVSRPIRAALRQMDHPPRVIQASYSASHMWHYISRSGQRDYLGIESQIDRLNEIVERIPLVRLKHCYPDLGWFNTWVLLDDWETYRWGTLEEFTALCEASAEHDAPIGLRTTIDNLLDHPYSDEIIQMMADARQAAEPPDCRADLNGDRTVGKFDLSLLLASWQVDGGGDCDADGDTDEDDLTILLNNWGADCS